MTVLAKIAFNQGWDSIKYPATVLDGAVIIRMDETRKYVTDILNCILRAKLITTTTYRWN